MLHHAARSTLALTLIALLALPVAAITQTTHDATAALDKTPTTTGIPSAWPVVRASIDDTTGPRESLVWAYAVAQGNELPSRPSELPILSLPDSITFLYNVAHDCGYLPFAPGLLLKSEIKRSVKTLDAELAGLLSQRVVALTHALSLQCAATASWDDTDRQLAAACTAAGPGSLECERAGPAIAEVNMGLLVLGADLILESQEMTKLGLRSLSDDQWPDLVPVRDPLGLINIGTTGADTYGINTGFWLSIDPAGNDKYYNNQGGANPSPHGDLFRDHWVCAPNPVGCWNLGSVNGEFVAPIAWFDDLRGNDQYGATSGARNQYVQGAAAPGGIGILIDEGGQNTFRALRFAQGAAETGVGILHEEGGGEGDGSSATADDSYAYTGVGAQFGMGAGVANGIGILEDQSGNDAYSLGAHGGGYAAGASVGIFKDYDGRDSYSVGGVSTFGVAVIGSITRSLAAFRDFGADADTYPSNSLGWGNNSVWNTEPLRDASGNPILFPPDNQPFYQGSGRDA